MSETAPKKPLTLEDVERLIKEREDDPKFNNEVELVKHLSRWMIDWLMKYEPGIAISSAVDALTSLMVLGGTKDVNVVLSAIRIGFEAKDRHMDQIKACR